MAFPNLEFTNIVAREQASLIVAPQIYTRVSHGPEPEPACLIKYSRDLSFIGREEILDLVEAELYKSGGAALTGPGGIGKTEIAIQYCHRFYEANKDFWVFWVHASSREDFKSDYRAIALALRLVDSNSYSSDDVVFRLLENWFKVSKRWLLVVDNADCYRDFYDSDIKFDDSDTLAKYLPGVEPHYKRVLFTSRDIDLGDKLAHAESIIVDRLSDSESSDLLRKNIASGRRQQGKSNNNEIDEKDVQELLIILDYLPLAIIHAASFIKKTHMTVKDYTSELQKSDEDLISYLEQLGSPTRPNSSSPKSVVRTWLRSFTLVLTKNEKAAHLFCLMACMDRNTILTKHLPPWVEGPSSADDDSDMYLSSGEETAEDDSGMYLSSNEETGYEVQTGVDLPRREVDRAVALCDLEALSLIKRQESGDAFSIHRLVQAVTIHFLKTDKMSFSLEQQFNLGLLPFQESLIEFLLEQIKFKDDFPRSDMDFQITSELLPHAKWLVSQFKVGEIGQCALLRKRLLRRLSNFHWAREECRACVETCQLLLEIHGHEHMNAAAKWTLVGALAILREFDKVVDKLQELDESDSDWPLDRTSFNSLPIILLSAAGRHAAAVQMARSSTKSIQGTRLDDAEPGTVTLLNVTLAICLLREGAEHDDAEVLKCIENSYDGLARSTDLKASLPSGLLVHALRRAGRYAEAVVRTREGLEHVKAIHGPSYADALHWEKMLISTLFEQDVGSLQKGEMPSLDRLRELNGLLEDLWHRMMDFYSLTSDLYHSTMMQELASIRAETLCFLHTVLWLDLDKLCDQSGSTNDDEIAFTNYLKLLKERYEEICGVHDSAIKYCTLAIEGYTRTHGVVHPQTLRLTSYLCQTYMARNLNEVSEYLRDRTAQIVCAVHQGIRIDEAMWPLIFDVSTSGPCKDNFDCFGSLVLACAKQDSALLRADPEIGMRYLDQLNRLEDLALIVDIRDAYDINRRPPHNIECEGCGDPIYGIRHACLGCNLCSDCVGQAAALRPSHDFSPVFIDSKTTESVFEQRILRGRVDGSPPVLDNPRDYAYQADPAISIDLTVAKHWRKMVATERDYESEPDEGGRKRSRLHRHCERGRPSRYDVPTPRHPRRSKSYDEPRQRQPYSKFADFVIKKCGPEYDYLWYDQYVDHRNYMALENSIEAIEQKLRDIKARKDEILTEQNLLCSDRSPPRREKTRKRYNGCRCAGVGLQILQTLWGRLRS